MRLTLFRLSGREHVLLVVVHHNVFDGTSMGVFNRELELSYATRLEGGEVPWPALPIRYGDYAVWQRRWLQGDTLEHLLRYWRDRLAGAPRLELPIDLPPPATPDYRIEQMEMRLDDQLAGALKRLAEQYDCSLLMLLVAAFKTLLHRYSGQEDMVVGVPVSGRRGHVELRDMIGYFVNTVVQRSDLSGDPAFTELLRREREAALGAYRHSALPFDRLVEELRPERQVGQIPLVNVLLNFKQASWVSLQLPGLEDSVARRAELQSEFAISLEITEASDGLTLELIYRSSLFSAERIDALLNRHFLRLLQGIVDDPQLRLSQLPLLTEAERRQLLVEWNDTAYDYPHGMCMHRLFEEQALRTPDGVALLHQGRQLSYAELDERANRLAQHLRGLGVDVEARVAICVERSFEMIIALLGVLKAGAAWVPLDPDYPAERLEFMLEDSAASVLLTQARLREHLPQTTATIIYLDDDWPQIVLQPDSAPETRVTPRNLAYVIYTSGSTGKPKGVAIEHRSIVEHCHAVCDNYRLTAADRVFQFASFSFDASIEEILPALTVGASVVLGRHALKSPQELDQDIRQHAATVLLLTTSFCRLFLQNYSSAHPWPGSLRLFVLGGEELTRDVVEAWQALPGKAELVNTYGPTEATIFATFYRVPDIPGEGAIPIGRPIRNTRIHILDSHLQPVPVGVAGELHIGGIRVARGYLNRAELTAEKFIPDPFGEDKEARLYRSGDRARYLPDGNIEFLGRVDDQVKIRGYRIEPGEIAALLRQAPEVDDAAVVVLGDRPEKRHLVAYVVPRPGTSVEAHVLRDYLLHKLPDYMVPAAWVVLDALPLSPNGKLERKALPVPDDASLARRQEHVAPATPLEENMCGIWAGLLGLQRVGMNDDFFELGGHSLLGTQLVVRVGVAFGVNLSLRNLFDAPTVAGLCREVERLQWETVPDGELQQKMPSRGTGIPLSYNQLGFWLTEQLDPGNAARNVAHHFWLRGELDVPLLKRCLDEIVARHDVLRTTFGQQGDEVVQIVVSEMPDVCLTVDLSGLPEADRALALRQRIADASNAGFDLQRGPLVRFTLYRLAAQEHVLLMVVHHIVFDGWSSGVINRELEALYGAYRNGQPSPLPDHGLQYADYSLSQLRMLQGDTLAGLLAYWRQQLENVQRLQLPADRMAQSRNGYQAFRTRMTLPPGLSSALQRLAAEQNCTLFMLLTAAFKLLMHRHSGQEDIVVGAPIAGERHDENYRDLIGAFINTIVLRTDLSGDPEFSELLQRERNVALGAYRHSRLPFDKLVQELRPQREAGRNPIVDVLVNFGSASWHELKLDGLAPATAEICNEYSSFALTLELEEQPDGIDVGMRSQSALFSDGQIRNLMDQYRSLLEQAVAGPRKHLSAFSLLTPAARARLPDPSIPLPAPAVVCIPQQVAGWAKQTPDQVAIRQGGRDWNYAELARCSQELARQLIVHGVRPGDVVALNGSRSFGLVCAMLAIFMNRAVLLSLDRILPEARQRLMREQARAAFQVRVDEVEPMPEADALPTLHVDATGGEVHQPAAEATGLPETGPAADDPAYIFFTSGSSGVPKGVTGTHLGMMHMISWQRDTFSITPEDRCAQLINLSFDAVMRDIFLPLVSGATLCLPQPDEEESGRLPDWLARERITLLHTVPSLARTWLTDIPQAMALPSVRLMFFTGEALSAELVGQWRTKCATGCRFVNLYGPTETTMIKSFYIVPEDPPPGIQPLGQALPDTQIMVLGRDGRQCGVGEPGELVIRTPCLTLGYLHDGGGGFASNPFRHDAADRVYRTGDLGCQGADGQLHILGRLDRQVKIHGVRIEPDEVTSVLARCTGVRAAIALGRKDESGADVLVAYLVLAADFDVDEVRAQLARQLPFAMIPSVFVPLDALPLLPNGKIDTGKLPAWDAYWRLQERVPVAPESATEITLVRLWRDVLQLDNVGVGDNFFEQGGHSLSGMQLIARVNQAFDIQLPLLSLFDQPTIRAQGREIDAMQSSRQAGSSAVHATTLPELLAAGTPTAIAILAPGREPLHYAALRGQFERVGALLRGAGLQRNDRIAVVLPNGPEMAVTFLAVAAHATCAPLNPSYTAEDFAFYLDNLNARALLVQAGFDTPARDVAQRQGIAVIELHASPGLAAGLFELDGMATDPAAVDAPAAADVALVLHTSGTTSRPKQVPLTHANLCASAYNIVSTLALTERDRCLNILPLFHIHGLVACLLAPLASGGSVACTPGLHGDGFFGWLEELRPTWYSGVPTMHQNIVTSAGPFAATLRRNPLRFIRSSSAALSPQLLAELEQCFAAPVIEAYGMTEAAHQIASNPLPPAVRKPGSVGRAAGPEVAILDAAGNPLAVGEPGEIAIRGANVTAGYHANDEANRHAYVRGWLRTGDLGQLDDAGYLTISGRIKELINRGGEKISPREIDEAVLDCPGVAQALAFAVPHPTLGEDLALAVVLRPGAETTAAEIREHAFSRLPAFKVPSQVVIVDGLPKGPTGKVQRIGLSARLADRLQSHYVAPANEIEQTVAGIFASVLQRDTLGTHDNFFYCGGDSLLATRAIADVAATLGIELPATILFQYPTVAELSVELLRRMGGMAGQQELHDLLGEIEQLSDEEAAMLLSDEPGTGTT